MLVYGKEYCVAIMSAFHTVSVESGEHCITLHLVACRYLKLNVILLKMCVFVRKLTFTHALHHKLSLVHGSIFISLLTENPLANANGGGRQSIQEQGLGHLPGELLPRGGAIARLYFLGLYSTRDYTQDGLFPGEVMPRAAIIQCSYTCGG